MLLNEFEFHSSYREYAWTIFLGFSRYARAPFGFATTLSVLLPEKTKIDKQESFWIAETLKYLYLIFCERDFVEKIMRNFVFSTEGHLFRRAKMGVAK